MHDIDYSNKSDRDLLIEVVTISNGMTRKLDRYCDKVDVMELEHTRLKKEHELRMGECSVTPLMSRKDVMASAGAGGGIVGAIVILVQVLTEYFK